MTYYLLLSGDSEKDTLYETNVLGEESFKTFYPSVGFIILNRIINQQPELRSEERRVGKECRSRWSPYH